MKESTQANESKGTGQLTCHWVIFRERRSQQRRNETAHARMSSKEGSSSCMHIRKGNNKKYKSAMHTHAAPASRAMVGAMELWCFTSTMTATMANQTTTKLGPKRKFISFTRKYIQGPFLRKMIYVYKNACTKSLHYTPTGDEAESSCQTEKKILERKGKSEWSVQSGKTGKEKYTVQRERLYKEKKYALQVEYRCMTRGHKVRNKVENAGKGKRKHAWQRWKNVAEAGQRKKVEKRTRENVRVTEEDGSWSCQRRLRARRSWRLIGGSADRRMVGWWGRGLGRLLNLGRGGEGAMACSMPSIQQLRLSAVSGVTNYGVLRQPWRLQWPTRPQRS